MIQAPPLAQRVRLRPERPWKEHLGLYRGLFAAPAVAEALWPNAHERPPADRRAAEILARDLAHWQRESFGPWVFFETASGSFVGRGGLRRTTLAGRDTVELLYAVHPQHWGSGYATEMATLAIAQARRLGLGEVVGFAAITNGASRRVLEKAGLHFEAFFQHAGLSHWLGRWSPATEHLTRPMLDEIV